ncbi:Oleoyl-acyl carrier protein thioesterase 1, chloroplastic [Zea mays]|uniref:Acyl-[acyl-carrier-protein] hydrolase n=2 Tax=Zea mays TaxID=4577 RepID=A0A3L6FUI9_MAIZE|nr:Oleoyl-acyl carrier protein thioesterase 1, chloroplastic [Zea mays]
MLRCHAPPQCGRAPLRHHGRWESSPAPGVVVRCTRGAPQVSGIEAASPDHAAATAVAAKAEGGDARPSLAERLRLGSLLEDGLSYKESFIVRCYEVGINKTATVETIANLLQEVGCNHAQSVGFSTDGFATTTTMRKLGLIWVTNRMHIEIYKYPAWGDVVEIETWCQEDGKIGTRRDWILKDLCTGEVTGRATSMLAIRFHAHFYLLATKIIFISLVQVTEPYCLFSSKWVMMNQNTRRLQRVSDDVRDEVFIHCPKTPRLAFPEENNGSLKKIPNLSDPAQYSRLGLVPRRADLDMNQHVNNVTYIGWVLESIPQDIIDTHELQTITLDYRRECQHDDIVDSLTYVEEGEERSMNGSASSVPHTEQRRQFLHCLRFAANGDEINRGRTAWRKLAR